uniref:Transcriptional regulator n=1 Tax=Heterorhabditis bacteriophora TaxID=37862 RepID=A0A1I7WR77_HETBA
MLESFFNSLEKPRTYRAIIKLMDKMLP